MTGNLRRGPRWRAPGKEVDDGRQSGGVLHEEGVASVEHLEPRARDARGQELAVGEWCDPVEVPAAHQGWARDGAKARGGVVLCTGGQLVGQALLRSLPRPCGRAFGNE